MASEDLLKKAVAAFNALSPEQQAEMLEEQRQSWVRGNVGLSRDERGMTSPVMPRPTAVRPGSLVNDADIRASDPPDVVVKKLDAAFDALALPIPVAPLSLETVMRRYRGTDWPDHYPWAFLNESECQGEPGPRWIVEELCRRSQAAEILAAERAESERLRTYILRAEKAEAKLAAAEKALEPFAEYCGDHFDKDYDGNPLPDEQKVGWVYLNYGHFRKARAVLGGKSS